MADKKISQLTAASTPLDGTEVLPIVQSGSTVKVANNDLRPKQIQSNATSGVLQIAGPAAGATRVMTTPDANFTAARTDAAQTFTGDQTFSKVFATSSLNIGTTNVYNLTLASAGNMGFPKQSSGASYPFGFVHEETAYGQLLIKSATTSNNTLNKAIAEFSQNGNITVSAGNLVQGTAAKGINFTANTAAAGMTSQLLNWYEEGTWTPTQGSGLTVSGSFASSGKYTRVGRLVTVYGQVDGSTSVACAANQQLCGGLPFASSGGMGNALTAANNFSGLYSSGSSLFCSAAALGATGSIYFSATYQI